MMCTGRSLALEAAHLPKDSLVEIDTSASGTKVPGEGLRGYLCDWLAPVTPEGNLEELVRTLAITAHSRDGSGEKRAKLSQRVT
jgi:hypothetical protein